MNTDDTYNIAQPEGNKPEESFPAFVEQRFRDGARTSSLRPKPVSFYVRRFLACNPLYPTSAALLLFGLYRVSVDPHFLSNETAHLLFNFSSLQLYELLLAATAIFLASRAIWYDSMLLVSLENMLVLVPLILISQAALIDRHLVGIMCLAAGFLALARFGSLKWRIRELNFPLRLSLIGLVMLGCNVVLPIVYRILHENKFGTKPDFGPAYFTNRYLWLVALPLLGSLLNFVPFKRSKAGNLPARGSWPLRWFCLWLVATVVHVYCLGYVYDFELHPEVLAPFAWVMAWSLYHRAPAWFVRLPDFCLRLILIVPGLTTLMAFTGSGSAVFLLLTLFNATIYERIYCRYRGPRLVLHLFLLSLAGLVAGLPQAWAPSVITHLSRGELIAAASVGYLLVCILLSRDPRFGIVGALVALAGTCALWPGNSYGVNWAAQIAFIFLLVHSLRWNDLQHRGARGLRLVVSSLWVMHSYWWMSLEGRPWMVCAIAFGMLVVLSIHRFWKQSWGPLVIPVAALLAAFAGPTNSAIGHAQTAPTGLLAVLGSFLLFGLGTLTALTRNRWHKPES